MRSERYAKAVAWEVRPGNWSKLAAVVMLRDPDWPSATTLSSNDNWPSIPIRTIR